jgi:hypothetical protein
VICKIIGTLLDEEGAKAVTRLMNVAGTWKLCWQDQAQNLYAALS